jgi:hypothetical protein
MTRYLKYLTLVLLYGIFPLLGYWANNLGQVRPDVVFKPALIIALFSWILYSAFLIILRSFHKSALISLLILILFFSFGHVDNLFSKINTDRFLPFSILLLIVYILIFNIGTFLIFRIKKIPEGYFNYFYIMIGLLILFNLSRAIQFEARLANSPKKTSVQPSSLPIENLPDIYYIVLDSYSRDDILQEMYNVDNSAFLGELQLRGFYLPKCAFSNYDITVDTISSVLNMNYLDELRIPNATLSIVTSQKTMLILDNQVRHKFAELGYQFVATRGWAAFNNINNADIYLNYYESQRQPDTLSGRIFVNHFLDTTFFRGLKDVFFLISDSDKYPKNIASSNDVIKTDLDYVEANFWFNQTNYVFDSLADLPEKPGNYLVYAHINSPHIPYVFSKDGSFRFSAGTTDQKVLYADTLVYLNQRVLKLVDTLIEKSNVPPIIIIQADHGTQAYSFGINKHKILSAYYLPGENVTQPYPTITPVNNFRLILKDYFDPSVELLPDILVVKINGEYKKIQSSCTPLP